jgi:hypothetical protein
MSNYITIHSVYVIIFTIITDLKPLFWAFVAFSFPFSYTQSVWILERGSTLRNTQTHNKLTPTSMPRVGFKPGTPIFEGDKVVYALVRLIAPIGYVYNNVTKLIWYKLKVSNDPHFYNVNIEIIVHIVILKKFFIHPDILGYTPCRSYMNRRVVGTYYFHLQGRNSA